MLAKPGLDGHDVGVKVLAHALKEAGHIVVYTGLRRSIEEIVRSAGHKVQILPRVPVTDSINAARTIFNKCYFDRENTADGLQCLRHYRYDVDESGAWSQKPLHDQYSHGADAFRMLGLLVNEPKKSVKKVVNIERGSWMS